MKEKVILDIDSVGDDILAVLFGAHNKAIDLLGITTVTGAAGDIQQAAWVAKNTVELTDKDVEVYAGASEPLNKVGNDFYGDPVNFEKEYAWKFGERLEKFNTKAEKPLNPINEQHAIDYIIETVHQYPNEVNIVITGPCTNVAMAFEKDPTIIDKVKKLFVLGGCFNYPGNITPVVEYNIWGDPEAARIVLRAGIETVLVPLDICENNEYAAGMLTRDDLYDLATYGEGRTIDYIVDKFPIYIDLWREAFDLSGFPMDDIITLALVSHPELCTYSDPVTIDVELEGKLSRGQTIAYFWKQILKTNEVDLKNVRIAQSINGRAFIDLFKDTLIHK